MGDTSESREGSQFGPYRLRRLVGRGGMGDVYEAEDTVRERIVALKLMSETLSRDPVFRARMQREARTAGRSAGTARRANSRLRRDRRAALRGHAPDRRQRYEHHAEPLRAAHPAAGRGDRASKSSALDAHMLLE